MGQSQNSAEKPKDFVVNFQDKKLDDNIRDYSSYKGIRSETDSYNIMKATNENTSSHSEAQPAESLDLVETTLTWKEGGSEVFITGSFSNWKQWFTLDKVGDSYNLRILLPKEKHYFKFIVDKQWVCSSFYQTQQDDKGNLNNIIDLTKVAEEEKPKAKKIRSKQFIPKEKKNRAVSDASQNSYSESKPDRSNLNSETPVIPCPYLTEFSINCLSSQKKNEKKQYVNKDKYIRVGSSDYHNCNTSASPISPGPHVNM